MFLSRRLFTWSRRLSSCQRHGASGEGTSRGRVREGGWRRKNWISRVSEEQSEALLKSFINNILHRNGSFFYIFIWHFPPEFIAKECMYCIVLKSTPFSIVLYFALCEGSTSLLNSVDLNTIIPSKEWTDKGCRLSGCHNSCQRHTRQERRMRHFLFCFLDRFLYWLQGFLRQSYLNHYSFLPFYWSHQETIWKKRNKRPKGLNKIAWFFSRFTVLFRFCIDHIKAI